MTLTFYADVWDALATSPAEAANLKARSSLMTAIGEAVEAWGGTRAEKAKRLGISQPRLEDLLRGRLSKFSLDALVSLATRAGLEVTIAVRPAA